MDYILFEDAACGRLKPFTWLRPVYELLVGRWTPRQRWQNLVGRERLKMTGRREIIPLLEERFGERARSARGRSGGEGEALLINGGWIAPPTLADLESLVGDLRPGEGLRDGGRILAIRPKAGAEAGRHGDLIDLLAEGSDPPGIAWKDASSPQKCLGHLWDLLSWSAELLPGDLHDRLDTPYGEGVVVQGEIENERHVSLGAGVHVARGAFLDAGKGPVVLEAGCKVNPFTWVRGPVWAGPGTRLLGERIEGSAIGPECRIHGELEESIVLGYSNKAHEGFVGHSYLGEWVNLGALTTTSDLKNTYGIVRIMEEGRAVSSGLMKVGSFLGDHTKTALATLMTTGCVTGVGSHLFGGSGWAPAFVPSFCWGQDPPGRRFELERFLETARKVMGRRSQTMSPEMESRLRDVFERTGSEEGGGPPRHA
jgi:UDP-N-acetylglucosamine diphosphorylase/glucosamine-1-phosphate N-acetyltransferase